MYKIGFVIFLKLTQKKVILLPDTFFSFCNIYPYAQDQFRSVTFALVKNKKTFKAIILSQVIPDIIWVFFFFFFIIVSV